MNWYKIAQVITEVDIYDPTPGRQTYMGIGHDDSPKNDNHKIWVWKDGELLIKEHISGLSFTHKDVDKEYELYYKGRYDVVTEKVSIVKPDGSKFRPIPEQLVRDLTRAFGDNIEIYVW